jgi:tRNA threonylcarbamoyladenosine biosynthesis protein TsaB
MKRENMLSIDTADNKEVIVILRTNGIEYTRKHTGHIRSSQIVLPLIEDLVNESGLRIQDLTQVKVNTGPGSYTGLRVGVAIANALGTSLGIPVNGKSIGQLVEPIYT